MVKKPNVQSGETPEVENLGLILGTIGDNTWRMFMPSVGLTLVGAWLDRLYGTKPWLMLIGIVLGFLGAGLLVKKQLNHLKRQKGKN